MARQQVSVGITDGNNKHGTTRAYVNLDTATSLAEMEAGLLPWLGLLDAVTAGKIDSASLTVPIDVSGLTAHTPAAGVYLRSCGALSWPNASGAGPWEFVIPAILASLVSGDQLIVTEDGPLDLLTDLMGAAFDVHGTGDARFTDEDGNNLVLEPRCFHTWRKFGKNVRANRGSLGV